MGTLKSPSWVLSMLAALAVGAGIAWWAAKKPTIPPDQPSAPVLSLEKVGQLVSLKVNYSDVVEFDAKRTQDIPFTQFELRFGGTKVLLVARGECTVATDLSKAKFETINAQSKRLRIVLPAQPIMTARINHETRERGGSYFYTIGAHGLEPLIPDSSNREKAINAALAKAQTTLQTACASAAFITEARQNAEKALTAALSATGWAPTFEWR